MARQRFPKQDRKKALTTREKIDKLDFVKIKSFHSPKDHIKRKASHRVGEDLSHTYNQPQNHISIYKGRLQPDGKIGNNPIFKNGQNLSRHFTNKGVQMPKRQMKKHSPSLLIR